MLARAGLSVAALLALFLASREARAEVCTRPTDTGGYAGYSYEGATAESFDATGVRVWYAKTGKNAVRTATTRTDGVPGDVARVAEVTANALKSYAAMGFRPPVSDADPTCGSNGGDGRLDVYLVDFGAADGTTVAERCTAVGAATTCASFILSESNFEGRYPTVDEGIRTVLPHELFHAVQNAYDSGLDRFWAEGSAQWAAKKLDPTLKDLERFLPAFLADPSRSIDAPASGVTAGFLYGAALWPVFLTAKHDDTIVQAILEEERRTGAGALDAAGAVLALQGSTLALDFSLFSVWNAATNARAGTGGYPDAAKYPKVNIGDFPAGGTVSGVTSGLASRFYRVTLDGPQQITLDADPLRTAGMLLPLEDGKARVDMAVPLPARATGEAILVVSGVTKKKTDAAFTLVIAPSPNDPEGAPDAGTDSAAMTPATPAGTTTTTTGCGVTARSASSTSGASMLALGAWAMAALVARRRRGATRTTLL